MLVDCLGEKIIVGNTYAYTENTEDAYSLHVVEIQSIGPKYVSIKKVQKIEHSHGCKTVYDYSDKDTGVHKMRGFFLFPVQVPNRVRDHNKPNLPLNIILNM